jgi:hypothetical protein
MPEYTIAITWDDEAYVWCAESDDIPLALESGSLDALIERIRYVAPEILAENGKPKEAFLNFVSRRRATVFA